MYCITRTKSNYTAYSGEYIPGMYKVHNGEFIKSVAEEYQVVTRGKKYHGCGEEYNVKKGKGEAISSSHVIVRLLGRISRGEEDGKLGEENQDFRMWGRI